ncbi:intermembrane phospholipid transport protein YdbH family protein [Sphingomicrobium marinum]|uniref:intermembrane phospholipid transport protein YdbH family protein n=1 Tax=Sphingomicrobium marinum TaxID=1227950 RepID=UPI00223FFCD2|nr:YdbH domain-containing protein [Sphingomicrobium marinum]
MTSEEQAVAPPRRRGRKRRIAGRSLLFMLVVAVFILAGAWWQRERLVDDMLRDQLAELGVDGDYTIERVGLRTQRFRNLVLGPEDDPDLTARFVELETRISLLGKVQVYRVVARGVRLKGVIAEDGSYTFGALDPLLPEPSDEAFTLPTISVDLADTAISLVTPYGPLGIGIEGSGNLTGGFAGKMAFASRQLAFGACTIDAMGGTLDIAITARRIGVDGPLDADALVCGDVLAAQAPKLVFGLEMAESFDRFFDSELRLEAAGIDAGQNLVAERSALRLDGAGPLDRIVGDYRFTARQGDGAGLDAGTLSSDGDFRLDLKAPAALVEGSLFARDAQLSGARLAGLVDALDSLGSTPLEPVADRLADALRRNARRFDAQVDARLAWEDGAPVDLRLRGLRGSSAAGGRLTSTGQARLADGAWRIDGRISLDGGGLPTTQLALRDAPGEPLSGVINIAPYRAGSASVALSQLGFRSVGDGYAFNGDVRISGPFKGGRVDGLAVPLEGRLVGGRLSLGQGCVPVRFERLVLNSLNLARTAFRLCGQRGALLTAGPDGTRYAVTTTGVALNGTLGGNPFALTASDAMLASEQFTLNNVDATLGSPLNPVSIQAERLAGDFAAAGMNGSFAGAQATIGEVPLLISDANGTWQERAGIVTLAGSITVSDRVEPVRFYPLVSDNARLVIGDGRIDAAATLRHPYSGISIADVTVAQDLETGLGGADILVEGINFGEALQPEEITPLTEGVVALVIGRFEGVGRIDWGGGAEVRSTGTFRVIDTDLAAAFGPVEGLDSTINFTNLLALQTAPAQIATVDLINPGIPVENGVITYQLLGNKLVKIDEGRWPFMGGTLTLDTTVLNFESGQPKRLTFVVDGFDAAIFADTLELTAVSMSGIFDGVLPTIFDIQGGRVVGGRLDARPGGGILAYNGDWSESSLATRLTMGLISNLRYESMIVRLDGDLDGEFATRLDVEGVRLGESRAATILKSFTRVPVNLNVTITGPLRAVIATLQSFRDPRTLITDILPQPLEDIPGATTSVTVLDEEREEEQVSTDAGDVRKEEE